MLEFIIKKSEMWNIHDHAILSIEEKLKLKVKAILHRETKSLKKLFLNI